MKVSEGTCEDSSGSRKAGNENKALDISRLQSKMSHMNLQCEVFVSMFGMTGKMKQVSKYFS